MRTLLIIAGVWTGLSIVATGCYSMVRVALKRRTGALRGRSR